MGMNIFADNKLDDAVLEPKLSEIKEEGRKHALELKVIEVCEHIINTKDSYRKTAAIFGISVATVSDYCKRFEKIKPIRYKELKKVIDANTEPTIKDEIIKKRVLENAKLIVSGKTIEEISIETGIDYWIVYRDIHNRLKNIDMYLYQEVCSVLESRKNANLIKGNK